MHTQPTPSPHTPTLTHVSPTDTHTLVWLGFWLLWTGADHTFQTLRFCVNDLSRVLDDPHEATSHLAPKRTKDAAIKHTLRTLQNITKRWNTHNTDTLLSHLLTLACDALNAPKRWVLNHTTPPSSPLPSTPFLFGWGDRDALAQLPTQGVAMVGSRKTSHDALQLAFDAAQTAASHGSTILSGGALGVDTASHKGALSLPKGQSIAILGSGLNHPYPHTNQTLFHTLSQRKHSCVLSPFPPNTRPSRYSFPQRNAWIAALSHTLILVRARQRSGSLITAQHAQKLQRRVFAFPSSPNDLSGLGTNTLIASSKASLLLNPQHLARTLYTDATPNNPQLPNPTLKTNHTPKTDPTPKTNHTPKTDPLADSIQRSLQHKAIHPDDIARLLQIPHNALTTCLLELELNGCVQRLPGGLYSLKTPHPNLKTV